MMRMNDYALTSLHGSVIYHIQCQLALFLCPTEAQAVCFNG